MPPYIIKPHAQLRMKERGIAEGRIREALKYPTKIEYDEKGRILFKKVYGIKGKRLLLVAAESVRGKLEIITVIDTSKVEKYL